MIEVLFPKEWTFVGAVEYMQIRFEGYYYRVIFNDCRWVGEVEVV